MASDPRDLDKSLKELQVPLRSIGVSHAVDPNETRGENKTFGEGGHVAVPSSNKSVIECSFVNLGSVTILSGRVTPLVAWEKGTGWSSITMCYTGSPRYQDEDIDAKIYPGEILAVPRNGGRISTGYLSSINFPINQRRMSRTMRAMQCTDNSGMLQNGITFQHSDRDASKHRQKLMFDFFAYLDSLLAESKYIGKALGLDEQVYRLMALAIDAKAGLSEKTKRRWRTGSTNWRNPLDELIDYININIHQNLTLTDLEEQSHYSARHLQNLFKEKFDCTPMQFVRRQRLTSAMEKLQTADYDATVTSIGRDCGYRFTSNFTTDFHRQFGVTPSTVLRASRGGGRNRV